MLRTLILAALLGLIGPAAPAGAEVAAPVAAPALTLPAGMPLTRSFTEDLLSAALSAEGAGESLELRLEQPRLPLANPSPKATLIVVEELRYDPDGGRFSAFLVGTIDAELRFRLPAHGRARSLVELPVLTRAVAAGELIGAADLAWLAVAPNRLRPTSVTAAADLIGAEARRPLRPGRVLEARDLQAPRLVLRGRVVELVYATPGLQLRALGIAQADAALGELVRVVNPDSRRQLQGVVIGVDQVALGGPPPARAR